MIKQLRSMSVEDLQSFLNRLELLDSTEAARHLGLSPATLRNPKNRYFKHSIKLGQYRFWRKGDLQMSYTISRKLDGHTKYWMGDRDTNWSSKQSDAALYNTWEEAKDVREEIAGPYPKDGHTYGRYPQINRKSSKP